MMATLGEWSERSMSEYSQIPRNGKMTSVPMVFVASARKWHFLGYTVFRRPRDLEEECYFLMREYRLALDRGEV